MDWLGVVLFGLGAFAVAASVLPMGHTTHWWVRIWDFPRFQITLVALVVLVVTLFFALAGEFV